MDKFSIPADFPKPGASSRPSEAHQFRWLLLATGLTVLLSVIPYADLLVYPIRLFVTLIHETGHALATVLTFGDVTGLTVSPDESGLTWSRGGLRPLVASAGYLGSALFGSVLLLLGQRQQHARHILFGCGALVLAVTVFFVNATATWLVLLLLGLAVMLWIGAARPGFGKAARFGMMSGSAAIVLMLVAFWALQGTLFSWIVGLTLGAAFLVLGSVTQPKVAHFLVNFLAVQCSLNALVDIKTLFLISTSSRTHTDALTMQDMTGIPAPVWAVLWGLLALVLLAATLWVVQRRVTSDE